jgi:hypothetical protein
LYGFKTVPRVRIPPAPLLIIGLRILPVQPL